MADIQNISSKIHSNDTGADNGKRKSGKLIEQIFAGALKALQSNGYERVSMDVIARHAGVSRASLYNNFESKEALVRQLFEVETKKFISTVVDFESELPDPKSELNRICRRFISKACEAEALGIYRFLIAESIRFPWLGQIFVSNGSVVLIRRFEALLSALQEPTRPARVHAVQLYSLLTGAYYQFRVLGFSDEEAGSTGEEVAAQALETLGLAP